MHCAGAAPAQDLAETDSVTLTRLLVTGADPGIQHRGGSERFAEAYKGGLGTQPPA